MSADVVDFPAEKVLHPSGARDGDHEVYIRVWRKRVRRGVREKFTVEDSRAGSDWWGFLSDAETFDHAIRIALDCVEPGGVLILSIEPFEAWS